MASHRAAHRLNGRADHTGNRRHHPARDVAGSVGILPASSLGYLPRAGPRLCSHRPHYAIPDPGPQPALDRGDHPVVPRAPGAIDIRSFPAKLLAAIATVGFGGSAALEGPSIYGGAAIGSWLWTRLQRLRRLRLGERDRPIMLICG